MKEHEEFVKTKLAIMIEKFKSRIESSIIINYIKNSTSIKKRFTVAKNISILLIMFFLPILFYISITFVSTISLNYLIIIYLFASFPLTIWLVFECVLFSIFLPFLVMNSELRKRSTKNN